MSQEEATISRKEKKALRDAERRTKDKKRKHVETEESQEPAVGEESAKAASTKKSKKRKSQDDGEGEDAATAQTPTEDAPKPKKRKKTSKTTATVGESNDPTEKTVKPRFIVFVGNLPYKTTDAALRAHFNKLEPFTLRHRTDPKTKKSKGFAFLEFENYDRMKTVLKLYHHSELDAGRPEEGKGDKRSEKDKKKDTRKINVELTSGGGGNTDARKEKIKGKNVRLEEQRKRRAELEKVEKAKKEKKEGGKPISEDAKAEPVEGNQAGAGADATHGIHPSRLARIKR